MNATLRLASFLGLERNLVLLLVVIIVIGAGEEMWMRFLPKYLDTLGASALIIGLFDAIQTWLGAVYAYPGGVLSDRWGYRRAMMAFTALSILGYAVVLATPHWAAVIGGMWLFLAWTHLSLPAMFSLVGASLPVEKHTMGIGMQSLIKRVPILIGPLLGGVLLDRFGIVRGVQAGLAVSIALGAAALLIQRQLQESGDRRPASLQDLFRVVQGFDPRLRRLLCSDILIRFCERIPYAWVVIYAMDYLGISAIQIGLLTGIEMGVAMACYVPVAHYAGRHGREPFVLATFVFFTLFPLALLAAGSFPALVLAFVIRGLKEFGEPPRKALIIGYARPATGTIVGAYYLIRDLVVSAGSFIGAGLWRIGPAVNFGAASAAGALGTLLYAATLQPARRR